MQDSNNYNEENKSAGLNIGISVVPGKDNPNKSGIYGSASESNIDSKYNSVTDQSGIYAGSEGFDIYVEDNTDLKGGIISGENTDKNKLSTGTLTYEDIRNEAEYEAGSRGVAIDTSKDANPANAGLTPNPGMPAEGEAESTTKATVSEGEIEIRDKQNQKQDLAGLNRDTQNALNKLGEIFDKDSIEERQELAGLFGELAYKAVGDLAVKNGWEDGSAEKNALHAFVGGIMAELGGSDFLAGASGAMVNEMVQKKLAEAFKDDPAMHQWASTLIGGVVSEIVSGNAQAGASTAASGTKNNILSHEQEKEKNEDIKNAGQNRQSAGKIMDEYYKWEKIEGTQQDILVAAIQDPGYIERLDAALLENPDLTEFEGVILVGVDMYGNEIDARKPENRDAIINSRPATMRSIMNGLYDVAIEEALEVAEDSKVVKDLSQKYQWAVYAKTGIKYLRKIPLVSGGTLLITLNESSKNMSNEEFMLFAQREMGKFAAGEAASALTGAAIGSVTGPSGAVVGGILGVFVGTGFESMADMGIVRLQNLIYGE